ncbi:MAG: hypothetical protein AAFR61_11300 [Bacteroidota bacterium]
MKATILQSQTWGITSLIIILALLAWIISQCEPAEPEPQITVTDAIQVPISLGFYDANPTVNTSVPNVKVTLIDDTLGYIRTSSGTDFDTLTTPYGIISLGFATMVDQQPINLSQITPYRFRIKSEAPGYATTWTTVVIQDSTPLFYRPVYMIKKDNPPPGVSVGSRELAVNSGGFIQTDFEVRTQNPSTLAPVMTLSLEKGTRLLCAEGEQPVFDETVIADLVFASPSDSTAGSYFPNGFQVTDAFDINGDPLNASPSEPQIFITSGWFNGEITAGGAQVRGFSQPATITMALDPDQINPATGQPYQVPNRIPIYSLDNQTGVWFEEGEAEVINNPNGPGVAARFTITHLSVWNLDVPTDACVANIDVAVTNASTVTTGYVVEIVNADAFDLYKTISSQAFVAGPSTHVIRRAPEDTELAVAIKNSSGDLLATTDVFTTCTPASTPSLTIPNSTFCGVELSIQFSDASDVPLCDNGVWYSDPSCPPGDLCGCGTVRYAGALSPLGSSSIVIGTFPTLDLLLAQEQCLKIWYPNVGGAGEGTINMLIDFPNVTVGAGAVEVLDENGLVIGDITNVSATSGACPQIFEIQLNPADITVPSCSP